MQFDGKVHWKHDPQFPFCPMYWDFDLVRLQLWKEGAGSSFKGKSLSQCRCLSHRRVLRRTEGCKMTAGYVRFRLKDLIYRPLKTNNLRLRMAPVARL